MTALTDPSPLAATSPVSAVIVPPLGVVGSHIDAVEFHAIICPAAGAVLAIARDWRNEALRLVRRNPSTAGIFPCEFNCKILPAVVPVSTERVPFVVIVPPVR